jgi:membrane associated rhomboid family serine protease
MFPIGDASRRPQNLPIVTMLIILANAIVFLLELTGGDAFIDKWSVIPATVSTGHNLITILTAMFMHAGWAHILGNMIFLWAFGPEMEDVMGPMRYLIFYLIGGMAAMVAQIVLDPTSTVPNLGASGAIAAVMGGFLITFPKDQIRVLMLYSFASRVTLVPAIVLIGIWFLTQLFSEVGALTSTSSGGGVAYMAHIGGFIFGLGTARLFETQNRRQAQGLDA